MIFNDQKNMNAALKYWGTHTYQEQYEIFAKTYPQLKCLNMLESAINFQFPTSTKMNGRSIEDRRIYDGDDICKSKFYERYRKYGPKIAFTDLYYSLEASKMNWTPVTYMYYICARIHENERKAKLFAAQRHMAFREYIGRMCGRGLRALPSFIREAQLEIGIKDTFKGCMTKKDAKIDKKQHADIVMEWNKKQYYIWSYVETNASLKKVKMKLAGNKGVIPIGLHLFAPYDLDDSYSIYGWKFYPPEYFAMLKEKISDMPSAYTDFAKKIQELKNCYGKDNLFKQVVLTNKTAEPA